MTEKQYELFFDLLDQIINRDRSDWHSRKEQLVSAASEKDMTNLVELMSWEWDE